MFVIAQSQSYRWPVSVEIPVDGGKRLKQSFDAEFKRIPQSRIKEIGQEIKDDKTTDADLCKEVLVGWKGIYDGSNQEVPFSESAKESLLDVPLVAAAVVMAFFESLSVGKIKN